MKGNEFQRDLGQRMRYWRERAGISPAELASQIGVDPSAVSHWEAGRYAPRTINVEAVARACGIDMRMFWSPIDDAKAVG